MITHVFISTWIFSFSHGLDLLSSVRLSPESCKASVDSTLPKLLHQTDSTSANSTWSVVFVGNIFLIFQHLLDF